MKTARRAALVLDDSPFARHRRPSAYDLYEIIPDRATNTPRFTYLEPSTDGLVPEAQSGRSER